MISRQSSLSRNIVQFCRFLRQKGFALSVEEEITALKALELIDLSKQDIFRQALKSIFCRNQSQFHEFDSLYDQYWKELARAVDSKIKTEVKPVLKSRTKDASFKSLQSWLNGNRNEETEQIASYSIQENLSQKDFSLIPSDELDELMRVIKTLSRRLAHHINRRYEKSEKTKQPDLRRTLRKNMRHGGELLEIAFRKPKRNRTKLVVLCDISKSMDLYSVFLLQFMYAFQLVYRSVETFAFGTSLQRLTQVLQQNDFRDALSSLTAENKNWSGGTRIGESLDSFIKEYASRVLNKRTIVIILSDGWDTGNPVLLGKNMEIIHSRSKKVIWLNPLAGYNSYRPEVAGMQAALPFVDVFAPAHNIDSLKKLATWL